MRRDSYRRSSRRSSDVLVDAGRSSLQQTKSKPTRSPHFSARRRLRFEALQRRELLAGDLNFFPEPTVLPNGFYAPTQALETDYLNVPNPHLLANGWTTSQTPLADEHPAAESDDGVDGDDGDPELNLPSVEEAFLLNSYPGADLTVYLDFNGHVTEGTAWNNFTGVDSIYDAPYNRSGSPSTFTTSELQEIIRIWQAVAEDFAPFNVNVTTEEPGIEALRKSGNNDPQYGLRVVQTDRNATCGGCGGIAFLGSFNWSTDTAAFSFNKGSTFAPSTITHEVGHGLWLYHDGNGGNQYYRGHGTGDTAWGPLMGAGWKNVEQFDSGEYFNHNNSGTSANNGRGEDDIFIIQEYNGISYRVDDHPNDWSDNGAVVATPLLVTGDTEVSGFGIIETSEDRDFFSFETGDGAISLDINPFNDRPNLDVWAGIYDSTGALVEQSNPLGDLTAGFTDLNLTAGTYYLRIEGVSSHAVYDPLTDTVSDPENPPWAQENPVGYSDYGSLGQYWISGTVVDPSSNDYSIEAVNPEQVEADAGQSTTYEFTITRSGDASVESTVSYRTIGVDPFPQGGNYLSQASTDDFDGGVLPSGTVTFAVDQTSATVNVVVSGDSDVERDEHFAIEIVSETSGWGTTTSFAKAVILNDESEVFFAELDASDYVQDEGAPGDTHDFTYEVIRTGDVSGPLTVSWSVDSNGVRRPAQGEDFVGGVFPSGTVQFAPGESMASLTVSVAGDVLAEQDETFVVRLGEITAGSAVIRTARSSVRGDILDFDDAFSLPESEIRFRWIQQAHSGNNFDHWAIDNVTLTPYGLLDDFDPDIDSSEWSSLEGVSSGDRFNGLDLNALEFGGSARPRLAELSPKILRVGESLSFKVISGSGSNGGNATESGEDLALQYSDNRGATWQDLQVFAHNTNKSWTDYDLPITESLASNFAIIEEGNLSSVSYEVPVNRTGFLTDTSTISWEVVPAGDNPVSAEDFVGNELPSGTLEFGSGVTVQDIRFEVAGDLDMEGTETFEIRLIDDGTEDIYVVSMPGEITEVEPEGIDYGSAPESYGTLITDDGAGHLLLGGYLGATRDADTDGTPGGAADDDDGVVFAETIYRGSDTELTVIASDAGILSAWVDLDGSGTFEEAEKVFDDVSLNPGANALQISIPSDAVPGETYTRFRFSTDGGLSPIGLAEDGEVEDYAVIIEDALALDQEVVVGDASVQRSLVRSLRVDFAGPVDAIGDASEAFVVTERVSGEQVNVAVVLDTIDGKTSATISFASGPYTEAIGGNGFTLANGDFVLNIDRTKLSVAGSAQPGQGSYLFGDERTDDFFRLLGDATGDGSTDLLDFVEFRQKFGATADPNGSFDFDGNGSINLLDFGSFRTGFGSTRADWS